MKVEPGPEHPVESTFAKVRVFLHACLPRLPRNLRGTHQVLSLRLSFFKTFTRFAIFNLFSSQRKGAFNSRSSNALISANCSATESAFFSEESEAVWRVYDTPELHPSALLWGLHWGVGGGSGASRRNPVNHVGSEGTFRSQRKIWR